MLQGALIPRLLAAVALAAALAPAAHARCSEVPAEDVARVCAAPLSCASATIEPEGEAPYRIDRLALPHRWDRCHPRTGGRATYRFWLPPAAAGEHQALFFTRLGNRAEIRVGGRTVARLPLVDDGRSDFAKQPLWVPVPEGLLSSSERTPMEIRVSADPGRWGGLAAFRFGPATAVEPDYRTNYLWRQTASVGIVISLIMMALFSGGLWWRQRDRLYGLLALICVFGVVRMSDRLMELPPLPWPLWGAVAAASFVTHMLLMARFALEAVGERGAWLTRGFWVFTVATVAGAFGAFLFRVPALWTASLAATLVPGSVVLLRCSQRALQSRALQPVLMCIAGFVVILAGLRDFLEVRVQDAGASSFSIMPHAIFVFVLFMGWIVVDRYSHQAQQYRNLTDTLERRISDREEELTATHARLQAQAQEQAALQERQRIMRDIHDGLGAHLVGLLGLVGRSDVDREKLQEEVNSALDELRIAVDSLQPVDGDLGAVLATLRYRLQPRLEAAGLNVVWDVQPLPPLSDLTPHKVLQIQRILLEAFTNVLRHSSATTVGVIARAEGSPARLVVEVADNGGGFDTDAASRGIGMQNMQARTASIGAKLNVVSAPGVGTRLTLQF